MSRAAFYGIGVGPGPQGLIPVAALEALRQADIIYAPRAKCASLSVARQCLAGLHLDEMKFKDVVFNMDPERSEISTHYAAIVDEIAEHLKADRVVAYLTLGDALTYSTYSYLLEKLLEMLPEARHQTFPGITSFAAIAAALDWPLGQGKQRLLVLPCPDDRDELMRELQTHDLVVLMKIASRLPMVLSVLKELDLYDQCAFGSRIGLEGAVVSRDLDCLSKVDAAGYLMTMLIRCRAAQCRADATQPQALCSKEAVSQ